MSKKVMQRTFWMIIFVFKAQSGKNTFPTPLFKFCFQKSKKGQK
uniref:Uncharacterized protein n=1 Tax=viral metagenome TaxID=1070528 RepID=A0A6C0LBH9_9ZZZZ